MTCHLARPCPARRKQSWTTGRDCPKTRPSRSPRLNERRRNQRRYPIANFDAKVLRSTSKHRPCTAFLVSFSAAQVWETALLSTVRVPECISHCQDVPQCTFKLIEYCQSFNYPCFFCTRIALESMTKPSVILLKNPCMCEHPYLAFPLEL
jgi:hypothetical protein